eukprot:m.147418 g.147418  ORF g.147418 m.147418 type:complete len:235 (+) comp30535_c0_seq1:167-871(+)
MSARVVSFLALWVSVIADYPPAPGSGGKQCTINAECGIPAANCNQLRKDCSSLSGDCVDKRCVCKLNQFGCSNCAARSTVVPSPSVPNQYEYSTMHEMLDGSHRTINECGIAHGGGLCQTDYDCNGRGGLCISGQCVCPLDWLCDDCSITLTDVLYGLRCGVAKDGGGACRSDVDCHSGVCEKTGGPAPFCACSALWGCAHCERWIPDLAIGRAHCPSNNHTAANITVTPPVAT